MAAPNRYGVFLRISPCAGFPGNRADANGETAGSIFVLFLSAFGFFFSRLLLC
jgi:hypothetical protein